MVDRSVDWRVGTSACCLVALKAVWKAAPTVSQKAGKWAGQKVPYLVDWTAARKVFQLVDWRAVVKAES